MANVLKADAGHGKAVAAFDRGALQEFIDPLLTETFEAEPEAGEVVEEEAFDPEALRAEVLAQAREEATRMVEEAYQEGLRRGEVAAREQFEAHVGEAADALKAAADAMLQARTEFIESLEPQVVALSVLAARRVLQRELHTDTELVHATVRRALERIADRQHVTVRLNPADHEALRAEKVRLLEDFKGVEEVELLADPALTRGSCVIDSKTMQADARLDHLLEDILAKLWE